jgi:hypothetical protein
LYFKELLNGRVLKGNWEKTVTEKEFFKVNGVKIIKK